MTGSSVPAGSRGAVVRPPRQTPEDVSLRNLWRFLGYARPYWGWLAAGMGAGLVRMGLPLYMPIFLATVIDYVVQPLLDSNVDQEAANQRLIWMLGLFGVLALLHGAATLGRLYFPHVAMASAMRDLRNRFYAHLQRLSLGFHTQRPTGGIVSRVISDVNVAQQMIDVLVVQASQQLMRAIVIVGILIWADWKWALVAFVTLPFFGIVTRVMRRKMRRASRKVQETVERMSGHVQERLAMIQEVQSFTAENIERDAVRDHTQELRDHTLKQRMLNGVLVSSSELTRFGALAIVIGFGAYRIMSTRDLGEDAVTVGMLVLFYQYTAMALQPLQFFSELYAKVHTAAASADRVFEFLDKAPDIKNKKGAPKLQCPRPPSVELRNVSFSYPVEKPEVILDDISLKVEPGMSVALVGESGAGKSTLMSLLPRFYDIQKGNIFIADQDITEVNVRSLRGAIGIVAQQPVLFSGTIRENICYGLPDASDEQVVKAAREANAHDFICEQPDGYETQVGERGVGLSGGQIQRLAIARAFLKDPAVLILDEATSNLDAVSESLVMDAVGRLTEGRTTFLIAHRLSTAREADLVVVMRDGIIAESGPHQQLLDEDGEYAALWNRQMSVATP